MHRITPKIALIVYFISLIVGLILYAIAQINQHPMITLLAIIAVLISLVARFGFYRCPECGRYLGRGFIRYCPRCGAEIDYF